MAMNENTQEYRGIYGSTFPYPTLILASDLNRSFTYSKYAHLSFVRQMRKSYRFESAQHISGTIIPGRNTPLKARLCTLDSLLWPRRPVVFLLIACAAPFNVDCPRCLTLTA